MFGKCTPRRRARQPFFRAIREAVEDQDDNVNDKPILDGNLVVHAK